MPSAYLSLGSNQGDRRRLLSEALRLLEARGARPAAVSSVYETAPVGLAGQPAFLNVVAQVETDATPLGLLAIAQAVEAELGRVRTIRWGPRTIDVDILLYEECRLDQPDLQIPHPRMHQRRFVLMPLVEIRPDAAIPGIGPAAVCLAGLDPADQPATMVGALARP